MARGLTSADTLTWGCRDSEHRPSCRGRFVPHVQNSEARSSQGPVPSTAPWGAAVETLPRQQGPCDSGTSNRTARPQRPGSDQK